MTDLLPSVEMALAAMSLWEALAVVLGVAYLLLAVKENILCWYAAFLQTAISIYVFWDVQLLMESALQVYYLGMAVYGWRQWKYGSRNNGGLPVSRWSLNTHLQVIAVVLLVSGASGYLLDNHSEAAWPYLDSFTTWASVLTTWMVARKILENWIYWLVIDAASIFLYLERGLYLYSLLFVAYLVIVVFGFLQWSRHYRQQALCPA